MHKRPYQNLIVWQEAHILCLATYKVATQLPSDERFRLVHQMCKSAYSVPMNIAEGNARLSAKEKNRFYEISHASLEELHYQCLLAKDLHYINHEVFSSLDDKIQRVSYLLTKLRQAFEQVQVSSAPSISSVSQS